MKYHILFFILAVVLFSCKKEEEPPVDKFPLVNTWSEPVHIVLYGSMADLYSEQNKLFEGDMPANDTTWVSKDIFPNDVFFADYFTSDYLRGNWHKYYWRLQHGLVGDVFGASVSFHHWSNQYHIKSNRYSRRVCIDGGKLETRWKLIKISLYGSQREEDMPEGEKNRTLLLRKDFSGVYAVNGKSTHFEYYFSINDEQLDIQFVNPADSMMFANLRSRNPIISDDPFYRDTMYLTVDHDKYPGRYTFAKY